MGCPGFESGVQATLLPVTVPLRESRNVPTVEESRVNLRGGDGAESVHTMCPFNPALPKTSSSLDFSNTGDKPCHYVSL